MSVTTINPAALVTLEELSIVTILVVTSVFFLILLILGVLKSHKLKEENERLSKSTLSSVDDNKKYEDFRQGHLYE